MMDKFSFALKNLGVLFLSTPNNSTVFTFIELFLFRKNKVVIGDIFSRKSKTRKVTFHLLTQNHLLCGISFDMFA